MLVQSPDEKRVAHSSSDVREICRRRLHDSSYPPIREVACESHAGTLILTGTVKSYFLKQVAQTVARGVPGVAHVDDRIRVQRDWSGYDEGKEFARCAGADED